MHQMKELLREVFQDLINRSKETDFQKAIEVWRGIVGEVNFAHTKIVGLTKEKMRVNVDSSARLYALNLEKGRIEKEIKKALNVEGVSLRLGEAG
jgi:hypothetical protein